MRAVGVGRFGAGRWTQRGIASRCGVACLALLAALSCGPRGEDALPAVGAGPEGAPALGAAAEPVVEVRTAAATRGPIALRISASGTLEARRESRIGPEVQGRLERVYVDEGDRFAAGDPLFEIDREPYEMGVQQAEAVLDLARAQRAQGESDLARVRSLQKQNVVAVQEMERIETALSIARATERQAEATLALARHQLSRTRVAAPWTGSVAARLADEGTTALVQPQTIVLVLQESGALEARAAIPESQLARVHVGDPAEIRVEGQAPIQTRVSAVGDSIDRATRTYDLHMPVANEDHALKAGVFALVEISPRAKPDALLVPREAIRSEDGRTRVFTIEQGRATPRIVTVGVVSEDVAEILDGLEPGEPVIVGRDAREIAPGMRVRVADGGGAS